MGDYKNLKLTYSSPMKFISGDIFEYDMQSAFLNFVLFYCDDIVSEQKLEHLRDISSNKEKRNIYIGLLQRSYKPKLGEKLTDLTKLFLDYFIKANNLTFDEIVSIKKDAIFVSKKCEELVFDKVKFIEKSHYNYFYKFRSRRGQQLELYTGNGNSNLKGAQKLQAENVKLFEVLPLILIKFQELSFAEFIGFSKSVKGRLVNVDKMYMTDESVIYLNNGIKTKYSNIKGTKYESEINYQTFIDDFFIPLVNELLKGE